MTDPINRLATLYSEHIDPVLPLMELYRKDIERLASKSDYRSQLLTDLSQFVVDVLADQQVNDPYVDPETFQSVIRQTKNRDSVPLWMIQALYRGVILTGTAADLELQYQDLTIDLESHLCSLIKAIRNDNPEQAASAVSIAAELVTNNANRIVQGELLWEQAMALKLPSYATPPRSIHAKIRSAIAEGDDDCLEDIACMIEQSRGESWEQDNLLACSPEEFEILVCDVYQSAGLQAEKTRKSRDHGVDIIIRRENGSTEVAQIKRYTPTNPVGIQTVQRTAGLTVNFDADIGTVVTSGRFSSAATKSADKMDNIRLINGETLCGLLNSAGFAVPP